MKDLLQELQMVSELSPVGTHSDVAKKVGISDTYLRQIRAGRNMTVPTKDNKKFMQKLITVYRKANNNAGLKLLDFDSPLIKSHNDLLAIVERVYKRMAKADTEAIEFKKVIENAKHLKIANKNNEHLKNLDLTGKY